MPPKIAPKKAVKAAPKAPPLHLEQPPKTPKTPKEVVVGKASLKRRNDDDDDSEDLDQPKLIRLSSGKPGGGVKSDAVLESEIASEKRVSLELQLARLKADNDRLRALTVDDIDDPIHIEDIDVDDSPGTFLRTKKSPSSSRTSSSLSPFNLRRTTTGEEAQVIFDTLLQCDFTASISALSAGLFCEAIINSVITPNSATSVPASVVGILKGLADPTSPLSMRTIATRDVAVALARSFTPALVARFLKEPRSPLCVSVFLNVNKGAFYSGDDMSTLSTTKFTSFSNESGLELLLIISRWQSLVSVFDPIFGAAAAGLFRCCSELLAASHAPLVVFRYVGLMRLNVSIGSMISDSMATLFVIDQNVLNQARSLAGPPRPGRVPPVVGAAHRPAVAGEGRDNHPRGRDNHSRDPGRRNRDNRDNHDSRDFPADDRPKVSFCRNWNDGLACFRSPCLLEHKCSFCSSKFHTGQACLDRPVDRLQILASPKAAGFQ